MAGEGGIHRNASGGLITSGGGFARKAGSTPASDGPTRGRTVRFNKDWDDIATNWASLEVNTATSNSDYSTFTRTGDTWCRMLFRNGTHINDNQGGPTHQKVVRKRLDATGWNAIYLRYQIKFLEGFVWASGGKLPGLIGGQWSGQSGGVVDNTGLTGMSMRMMWLGAIASGTDAQILGYVYDTETRETNHSFGHNFGTTKAWIDGKIHTVEQEIILNTPGVADGRMAFWLDGNLISEQNDRKILDTESTYKINGFVCDIFSGGADDTWDMLRDEFIEFGAFLVEAD